MTAIVVVVWIVGLGLAYVGLLWLAKKVYSGRFRAQAVVVAMLAAFSVGFGVSRPEAPPVSVPSPAAPVPAVSAAATLTGSVGVGARCVSARLAGAGGKGRLDTARAGGVVIPAAAARATSLAGGQSVIITGWAVAPDLKHPASAACLVVDGRIVSSVKAVYGTSRPDVARALGNPDLIDTGFAITMPAELVPAGSHTVAVASVGLDNAAVLLPGEVHVSGHAAAPSR